VQHLIEETYHVIHEDNDGFMGFGASHKTTEIYHYYEYFYQRNYHLFLSILELGYYTLYTPLFPLGNLNSVTKIVLNSLPDEYNLAKYSQFIDAYGTHIMVRADMGGMISGESWYDKCLEQHYTVDQIKVSESHSNFFGIFHDEKNSDNFNKNRDELF
jgi:hypothetical protein